MFHIRWTPPNRDLKRWGRRLPGSYPSRLSALQHMQSRGLPTVVYSIHEERV